MSCDCGLVASVHCLHCKVICHCSVSALQTNVSKWHSSRAIVTPRVLPSEGLFGGSSARVAELFVTLTSSGAERHSHRLRLVSASSQTPIWGKLIWIIPPCLHAFLWHKDRTTASASRVSHRESAKCVTETARCRFVRRLCQKAAASISSQR